jgi:1-acyl-sn-glycerol-3-phosphate acyltransferase
MKARSAADLRLPERPLLDHAQTDSLESASRPAFSLVDAAPRALPPASNKSTVGMPRRVLQVTLFYVLLLHLGAMSLTWNLVCAALYPFLTRDQGVVVGRAAISSVYRGFWACAQWLGLMRIDCSALDVLSRDAGLIIAANHPSMLDALLIVSRVPRGICIMRSGLMRNPFLGAGARLARYIRNDPPRGMIRGCVSNLQAGGQLVLFPEGTRTIKSPINPFRPGITLIAHMAQVPIQTVIIESASPYLAKGWPIWRTPQFPVEFRLRLGERFAPEADHQGLLKRLEGYFADQLR